LARASFWIITLTGLLVAGLLVLFQRLPPPRLGEAIGAAATLYLGLLVAAAWLRSHHDLVDAWMFLVPLSMFQVLPDWMLVQQRLLVFPALGGPMLGPVPAYMAVLWVAPLLLVIWLAEIARRRAEVFGLLSAAVASCAVFAAAEWAGVRYGLWVPRNVSTWHGIAPYVLAAETVLGVAAWVAFTVVQSRPLVLKVAAAAAVSACYAAALLGARIAVERL
jgi:hypothetical protein